MDIKALFSSKEIKAKEKTEMVSKALLDGSLTVTKLLDVAKTAKDTNKATCIEALEYATKQNPGMAGKDVLEFATTSLGEKAPRVKWESAKVIGNIAHLYPKNLDEPIKKLLDNTTHTGTVVRWSAAFALGEILKMKTPHNKELIAAIENIIQQEEKNSIKKIYMAAIKAIK